MFDLIKTPTNVRAISAQIIYRVAHNGRSLRDELSDAFSQHISARDKSFIQALVFGVCRSYFRLNAKAQFLLEKPLKIKDQDIYCLILVGLYQISQMRVPQHAAVAETVSAANDFKKPWSKNLINAVLRNYIRRKKECDDQLSENLENLYMHPEWMIIKIKTDWPEDWQTILKANNELPPFALRINQQKISREQYIQKFLRNDEIKLIAETQNGIILQQAREVDFVPGFKEGFVSVQDGASQLVAPLLDLKPNLRVLDACAAPGGKAAHILEIQPKVKLTAIDRDPLRVQSIKENFLRLHLNADLKTADANELDSWWDGQLFDRILLDAPCSASGVIRRHPDIKLLRLNEDIAKLKIIQQTLLNTLWPVLKVGGILLYTTCSLFLEENVNILKAFLAKVPDASHVKIDATWGRVCDVGRQILPGMHDMDGFYFALLQKGK